MAAGAGVAPKFQAGCVLNFGEEWKIRFRECVERLIKGLDPAKHTGLHILLDSQTTGLQTAWLPVSEVLPGGTSKESPIFPSLLSEGIVDLLEDFDPDITEIKKMEWI